MPKLKITVLTGGKGSEREISLLSGREVVKNLDKKKYEVKVTEFDKKDWIEKIKWSDVVFIAMHGLYGEDGHIQGFLDCLGKKYTGAGMAASSIGMDKVLFRALMKEFSIKIPKLVTKPPCVVKPVNQGSSIGVSMVFKKKDLVPAIKRAEKYGWVLVEEYVRGTELSCGVLGGRALPVVEICSKNTFFDYEAKYSEDRCDEIVPARISEKLRERVQKLAVRVAQLTGTTSLSRVDMIVRKGEIYVLETNTIPGMTKNSLLPKEAKAEGMSYSQLLDEIIRQAI